MSARIPYLLTRLLNSDELDALEKAFVQKSAAAIGTPAEKIWIDAALLLEEHRATSFQLRSKQTPSARRKSLGLRLTR
jgi:hypothetical protein